MNHRYGILGLALAIAGACTSNAPTAPCSGSTCDGAAGTTGPSPHVQAGSPSEPGPKGTAGTGSKITPEPSSQADPQVNVGVSSADQSALSALETQLSATAAANAESLIAAHAPKFKTELGYDPKTAKNLELIQASQLKLDDAELAKLGTQGFMLSSRQRFPNVAYGLESIYMMDLPLYVSVDAILETIYLSYDDILAGLESEVLTARLRVMLNDARTRLAAGPRDVAAADADLVLSVALSLLNDAAAAPVAGADPAKVSELLEGARLAGGIAEITLFGTMRKFDYTQFTPRGHYTRTPQLSNYFRAMIWLGRTDLRLIETNEVTGAQFFRKRHFEAMLALNEAVQGPAREALDDIDAVVTAFVGEHDYMRLADVDSLLEDLKVGSRAEAAALDPKAVAQTILDKGYGAQRIASQVLYRKPGSGPATLPLDRSFALLGQRYAVDSHVFSNVVYDRVPADEKHPRRVLPNPLDVAYAALGNGAALPLLKTELDTYGYAPYLERTRKLIDAHPAESWQGSLYSRWLGALRALSSDAASGSAPKEGMPTVTQTEPWSRRLMNTQLASWTELRHNTVLYVKQSYTGGVSCEYPDAYVDPYPEAFARIAEYAEHGKALMAALPLGASTYVGDRARTVFTELASVANILRDMAEQQLKGVPFNQAQLAFINEAVRANRGCGGPATFSGWYARLLYDSSDTSMKPIITDVHTNPGPVDPSVLHVATGLPRFMVVTVNTCQGPRAYAGVAVSYHEKVTGLERLTDEQWRPMAASAPDVPWIKPILP